MVQRCVSDFFRTKVLITSMIVIGFDAVASPLSRTAVLGDALDCGRTELLRMMTLMSWLSLLISPVGVFVGSSAPLLSVTG